jgi:hypothetical protein
VNTKLTYQAGQVKDKAVELLPQPQSNDLRFRPNNIFRSQQESHRQEYVQLPHLSHLLNAKENLEMLPNLKD